MLALMKLPMKQTFLEIRTNMYNVKKERKASGITAAASRNNKISNRTFPALFPSTNDFAGQK